MRIIGQDGVTRRSLASGNRPVIAAGPGNASFRFQAGNGASLPGSLALSLRKGNWLEIPGSAFGDDRAFPERIIRKKIRYYFFSVGTDRKSTRLNSSH